MDENTNLLDGMCEFLKGITDKANELYNQARLEKGKSEAKEQMMEKARNDAIISAVQSKVDNVYQFIPRQKSPLITQNKTAFDNTNEYDLTVATGGENMPPRLKFGEGTITKRSRETKYGEYVYWQARFYIDKKRYAVTAKTLREVMQKMDERKVSIEEQNKLKKANQHSKNQLLQKKLASNVTISADMTYGEWLVKWFSLYKEPNQKESSARNNRNYIHNKILPAIGDYPLQEVNAFILQEFFNNLPKGNTRDKLYDIVNASLRKAYALQLITFNPAIAVEMKNHKATKRRAYEFYEQNQMFDNLADKYKAVFFFLCCTGSRIGEFLALTDKSVDKRRHQIIISENYDYVAKDTTTTKTEKTRRVPYCDKLFEVINSFMKGERFFGTFTYDGIKKAFNTAIKKSGIENIALTHSARHTFSSVLYLLKVPDKQIQEFLGHSTLAMTMDTYTHLINDGDSPIKNYLNLLAKNYI